ncbi:MAG: PEP-CTERM sorting domain-containing protein [Deltaproteobacteria bacterium]|nr:PEP-CTERM sorting domain-containing protein [Deltaproteobacteria bacterium]
MKTVRIMFFVAVTLLCAVVFSGAALAVTITFFDPAQTATKSSGATSDTVVSEGYSFTYSLDKLFPPGSGNPTGRQESYVFPSEAGVPVGLHAQALTASDPVANAQISISRVDGNVFNLNALTFRLLANTSGAGAAMEITPVLQGIEGQIVSLDATGFSGSTFSYSTAPPLSGYDTYNLSLYVDFALLGVTLVDASVAPPTPDPGPSTIPEPETNAMMLVGLGVLAFFGYRRKQEG